MLSNRLNLDNLQMKGMKNYIQIAGVHNLEEAKLIADCGATAIGFPLRLPSNETQPDLSEAEARTIIQNIEKEITSVLITYLGNTHDILALCKYLNVKWVQLHGDIEHEEVKELKKLEPSLNIIKSLVVGRYDEKTLLSLVKSFSPFVDAFITDTFDHETGAYGATGKTHDWNISRKIVHASPKPVILAGGLTPQNVKQAILYVKPAGVDVHSGVENKWGKKDPKLVKLFIDEALIGFQNI